MAEEKYLIGQPLLDNIRRAVGRAESDPLARNALRIPTRLQDIPFWDDANLSRGTFTAALWTIGGTVAVQFLGETNTISVTNYCTPIRGQGNSTQSLNVIYGDIQGTMTAVEIQQPTCTMAIGGLDLTELPGYDSDVIQLLGHARDTDTTACLGLQWYSVTQCGTATAS